MSKERARRRAARLAEAERQRAARARREARRQRRRVLLRRLRPRPAGRTGRLLARRSRGERATVAALSLGAGLIIWLVVDNLALRLALLALLILVLPAVVVIALDRRT